MVALFLVLDLNFLYVQATLRNVLFPYKMLLSLDIPYQEHTTESTIAKCRPSCACCKSNELYLF